jgi:hypothetical protein
MLFDLFFLGLPIGAALSLANLALRDGNMKYWQCCFSFFAYIVFYLAGGREVLLYICCGMMIAHAWMPLAGS